jgi:hypothetical protein
VEHSDELASTNVEFVMHGRFEIELDAVNVVDRGRARAGSRAICHSTRYSDRRRAGGSGARRSRDIIGPGWAGRNRITCNRRRNREVLNSRGAIFLLLLRCCSSRDGESSGGRGNSSGSRS